MIFDAVKDAGVRALVSAGWGGLGGADIPENVFILEGTPCVGYSRSLLI
jgi:sterol 3beta-glucosyltransferase